MASNSIDNNGIFNSFFFKLFNFFDGKFWNYIFALFFSKIFGSFFSADGIPGGLNEI